MPILGQLEEFFSDIIYPNRYLFAAAAIAAIAALLLAVHRVGGYAWIARHRRGTLAAGIPALIVLVIGGYVLLSPLWERSEVLEASPLDTVVRESPTPASVATVSPAFPNASPSVVAFAPMVAARGEWRGADDFHFARGRALLIETAPGSYAVRVEDFSVRNGPDLFVYLSPSSDGFADGGLNLGNLKATDGAFNYDVPAGADISRFKSVVVWCRAFEVLFGTATLIPAM